MQLECSTDLQELAGGNPPVSRVTVRTADVAAPCGGPTARGAPAGCWPPPHFSDSPPEVIVENGVVEIHDPSKAAGGKFAIRDVNMDDRRGRKNRLAPGESITVGMSPFAPRKNAAFAERKATLISSPVLSSGVGAGAKQAARRFRGTLAGDNLRRVEFEGWLDEQAGIYSVAGKAEGVEISPDLRESLPEPFAAKLASLGNLRGRADLAFQVDYDRGRGRSRCGTTGVGPARARAHRRPRGCPVG